VRLHSLRERALLIAPIRIALGVVWLVVARLAGSAPAPAFTAFLVGTFATAFIAFADPRSRFRPDTDTDEPAPAPAGITLAPWWHQALGAAFPSTVGVSVLAAIAAAPAPTLTALLGGVSAGLGVAAAIVVTQIDPALLLDPRTRVVYRRGQGTTIGPCRTGS
jgi:hypothetical protein